MMERTIGNKGMTRYPRPGKCAVLGLVTVKRATSGSLRERLTRDDPQLLEGLLIQERPGKVCFRFWQEGAGYDRNHWTADAIQASIDYIHGNPVKRGRCQSIID
ncbi:hypothetical protein K2X85_20805 [bacterium]|nr:hypothetical protein [bacterium]